MVAPKVPRPRSMIIVIPLGILFILLLYSKFRWGLSGTVQGVGIIIDIVGVIVLAIPDIPYFNNYFFYGKVKTAVDQQRFQTQDVLDNVLAEPNRDERLIDALYVVEAAQNMTVNEYLEHPDLEITREMTPSNEGFYELRETFKYLESDDDTWDKVYGFKTFDKTNTLHHIAKRAQQPEQAILHGSSPQIRTIILMEENGIPKKKREGPYHMIFDGVEQLIEDYETKIRLSGLTLLLIGFLFQLLSLLF